MPRIVVTGSSGFIGKPLTEMLASAKHQVIAVTRGHIALDDRQMSHAMLESTMQGSHAVIHLAGRAHITREIHSDPLGEFRSANVNFALSVAEMAARAGVARFIFVSSIGVLGNTSGAGQFNESDPAAPEGPYAISKWEAEQKLQAIATKYGLQLVVVRPPLVYGPQVKGNFLRLLRLVGSGVPLPLGAISNCRSYIGVHNLCDFLMTCAFHPSAAHHTFHVADGEDVSTPDLLQIISAAMGKRVRLFRCPSFVRAAANFLGKGADFDRLTTNLRVDSSLARRTLDWWPPMQLKAGIEGMVRWFVLHHDR